METIEQLQTQFAQAQTDYKALKQRAEEKVVWWFWATGAIWAPEPFFFEQHRFSKGKTLPNEPAKKENLYCYGVDEADAIVVERQFAELPEQCYETFFFRTADALDVYGFSYGAVKSLIFLKQFRYADTALVWSCHIVRDGWTVYSYQYAGNKLLSKTMKSASAAERHFEYAYDPFGLLQSIKEKDYYWYQKKDKSLSYKKLTEMVSGKLFDFLKQALAGYNLPEKLYCIFVCYDSKNLLPPTLGFGTDAERQKWISKKGKDAKYLIWNPAEYQHFLEPQPDAETEKLFDLFNSETATAQKRGAALKVIVDCCKKLKEILPSFQLNKTEDFVIVAADYEQCDLRKNFKAINPELAGAFKDKLV